MFAALLVSFGILTSPQAHAQAQAQSKSPASLPPGAEDWIFPGQKLPSDIGFSPLRAGSDAEAEVKLVDQDWFLLQKKGVSSAVNDATKRLEIRGPVLSAINAQVYYRIVSGMILKESLQQLGMNSAQAMRFVEDAKMRGLDLNSTPLSGLGVLPQGFEDLNRNWERPLSRLAILPYMILPLSLSNHVSHFQHFAEGKLEKHSAEGKLHNSSQAPLQMPAGQGAKMCSTIKTAAPLADVQVRINDLEMKMDALASGLREAISLTEQSNAELVRLTNKVKEQSGVIEADMACFSFVKDRVSRGSAMPEAACLAKARSVFEKNQMMPQWEKFQTTNLQNPKGDFQVLQQQEIVLKSSESALAITQQMVQSLKDQITKLQGEKVANEAKLAQLVADKKLQISAEKTLNDEQATLNTEFQALQTISHKLESGVLSQELPDDQVKAHIADTSKRNIRILAIKTRLPLILQQKRQVQSNLSGILTQNEFLGRAIDTQRLQIEALVAQLGTDQAGLLKLMAEQTAQAKTSNDQFLAAAKESNFSEYVLSHLTRHLIENSKVRDQNFELLRKEEAALVKYKAAIVLAQKNKDAAWDALNTTLAKEKILLSAYRDPKEMGWFLETDCESRAKFDSEATGIYLSRSKVIQAAAAGQVVDAGRWGLFHMPYTSFKSSVQAGLLLDMPSYIQTSVKAMFSNYDYSMNQMLSPQAAKCQEAAVMGSVASIVGLLKSSVEIWNQGSDQIAKTQSFCANGPVSLAYQQSLNQMISFRGSVLDLSLPKIHQAQPFDLIERQAIEALMTEMAILTGQTQAVAANSDQRRQNLIKALIQVLATDYDLAADQSRTVNFQISKYQFATPAPGAQQIGGLQLKVADVVEVKSIDGVELFHQPLDRATNASVRTLFAGDKVKLYAVTSTDSAKAIQAGWLKVRVIEEGGTESTQEYFMPAYALTTQAMTAANGRAVYDLSDPSKCPVRRVVTQLTNFLPSETVVTRMMPVLKSGEFRGKMFQLVRGNTKTTPATIDKTYVACELYSVKGQRASPAGVEKSVDAAGVDYAEVQGVRIVEVKAIKTRSGAVRFVPTEEYGGFVQTWLSGRNNKAPRIQLGAQLDEKSWSVKP